MKEIKLTRFGVWFCYCFSFLNLLSCSGNKVLIILKLFRRWTNILKWCAKAHSLPYTHRWPGQRKKGPDRPTLDVILCMIPHLHKWRSRLTFYLKIGWHFGKASYKKKSREKAGQASILSKRELAECNLICKRKNQLLPHHTPEKL